MKRRGVTEKGDVYVEFDPTEPSELTPEQKARLERLAALPDEAIDTSDIPELTEDFFKNGVMGKFYRPVKQQITLRLDADVIAWFKAQAAGERGYQTRINRALREHVQRQQRRDRSAR